MRHLTFILLLIATATAQAQQPDDPPSADWYTVQLLVFEQASERDPPPPADPVVPDTGNAVSLRERLERAAPDDRRPRPMLPLPESLRFLPAPEQSRTLGEVELRLERSPRYRPVVRLAWRQRVAPFSDPVPVRVQGGEELGRLRPKGVEEPLLAEPGADAGGNRAITEVDGTVALVRGRYLHLHVDLVFRERARSIISRATITGYGDSGPFAAYPTWHIGERREIRPGELQYFDHRRFGVIAVATPWLAPETENQGPEGPAADLMDED